QRAFYVVSDLASVTLHEGLKIIGDEAFVGNPITAIAIPTSVSALGYEAFRSCTNLSSVTFADASNLDDLETNPFLATSWFDNHPDDYVMIDRFLIRYNGASSDVVIPANVEVIVSLAVQTMPISITSIDLGSVVKIHEYGISGYHPDLTSVHLPATLKYLGNNAVSSSTESITSITWDAGFSPTFVSNVAFGMVSPYGVFQEVTADNLVIFGEYLHLGTQATGVITVPEGVKIIGTYAFRDASVTEVVLPSSLEEIQKMAFYNSAITTITIPQNVKTIQEQAFASTAMLQTVNFLDSSSLEHVGNDPFYNSPVKFNYTTPEGFLVIGDVFFGIAGVFDSLIMPVGVNVFAMWLSSPVYANHLVIPANVMVATDYFNPGNSVVTLDFAGFFPNNEFRLRFFGGFYDPEIVIPALATLVLPTDVYIYCHYVREITTDVAFNDIAYYFDFYHPSVVDLE
ncbi:MAG: leucine-rich repeat protein, partial [Candidatus Izemoplasmatales bacterium]|nr:leucine-rich repeat protein [Candidatus Izemoplasmatales bacterium]